MSILMLALLLSLPLGAVQAAEPAKPAPLQLADPPEMLAPVPRSEDEQDRIDALSLFSHGRLLQQRDDDAGALRLYQRAFRIQPSPMVGKLIIALAAKLDRHAEAIRYALKVAAIDEPNPDLLKRLAAYLAETGDHAGALALYEKAMTVEQSPQQQTLDVLVWMEMGRLYHLLERYDKAAASFDRGLALLDRAGDKGLDERVRKLILGDAAATYGLIGESYLLAGQFDKAAAAFRKGHEAAPDKGRLAYQLARIDARNGKPAAALDKLEGAFREGLPDDGLGPYRLLAEVLVKLDREKELLPRLAAICKKAPESASPAYFLGEQHLVAGRLEQAEPLLRDAVAKAPTAAGYRSLIDIYRRTGRHDRLLDILGKAVAQTASLEPLFEKARPLSKEPALAEAILAEARKRALGGEKTFPFGQRLAAALVAVEVKNWNATGEFFDAAVDADPDRAGELLLTWGLALVKDEQYDRAAKVFRRGIDEKAGPHDSPVFYFYCAGALEMSGKTDEALAAADRAVELAQARDAARPKKDKDQEPKLEAPRHLARRAWVLAHAKRNDDASRAYRDLLDKYDRPGGADVRAVIRDVRMAMSNLSIARGNMPEAIESIEQVLDEFPDDVGAMNDLGYLWADAGQHLGRARTMIEKAVAEEPENAAFRDSLGWVLFKTGRAGEAVVELEKAAALEPDGSVLDHLGDAYRAAGQQEKARQAWQKAAAAFQKRGEPEKARQVEQKRKQ